MSEKETASRPFVTLRYGTGPLASLVGHSLCSLPSSLRSSFVPLVLGPSSRRACDSGSSSPRPARVNGRRFLHTSLHLGFRHSVHTALPSASPGTGPRATRLIIPSPGSVFLRPVSRLLASLVTRFVPHSRYSLCSSYRRAVPSLGLRPSLPRLIPRLVGLSLRSRFSRPKASVSDTKRSLRSLPSATRNEWLVRRA